MILQLLVSAVVFFHTALKAELDCQTLPTYFRYSTISLRELCEHECTTEMSDRELKKWDSVIQQLNKEKPLGSSIYRLRAYLVTAQRDAAFISYNLHHKFCGSLDPVSYEVVKLFYPSFETKVEGDDYSKRLASVVMGKVGARFRQEKENIREYPIIRGDPKLRDFLKPYSGIETASWRPWILEDPTKFLLPEPKKAGDNYWKEQAKIVAKVVSEITPEQREEVLFWSGRKGPGSGNFPQIVQDYMDSRKTPFEKVLFIRSVLEQAGVDTDIAVYFTKYTYVIPRPWMVNSAIKPIADMPHHPSYPSGHAALSAMYAVVLTHFFPENETEFYRRARDAALSRLWGGIHFPIDTWEGRKLGLRIGKEIVMSLRNQCF